MNKHDDGREILRKMEKKYNQNNFLYLFYICGCATQESNFMQNIIDCMLGCHSNGD